LRLSFRHLSRSALSIVPAVLLLAASQVRADPRADAAKSHGGGRFGVAASIQYAFKGSDNSVLPVVSLGNRDDLAQSPSVRLVSLHYRVDVGASARPESRADLAHSLMLPGRLGLTLGASHDVTNSKGTRVVVPEVSIAAKWVPWHADTTALKVGISGGLGFSANRIFHASIMLTRAVNAVGSREQKKLLAASNSPDLWASDVSVTAGLHSRTNGFGVFGAFGAYLFDSKFHVPPTGRSVFSLGIRKAFG